MRERDQGFLLTYSDPQACMLKARRGFLNKKMTEYKCSLAGEPHLKLDFRSSLEITDMWRFQ